MSGLDLNRIPEVFQLPPSHCRPLYFAISVSRLQILTLVELLFPFGHSQRDLDPAVLPVERQRNQGVAFDCGKAE
jgi:hypothetical protein